MPLGLLLPLRILAALGLAVGVYLSILHYQAGSSGVIDSPLCTISSTLNCNAVLGSTYARLFKIPDDPRVTRFGRVVRRWSIDELPQLVNVLTGDMSLVGPRPFFESDLDDYEAHHFRRLAVKPGLTGLWQVSGRSDIVDFEEVVRLDRYYIEHWSFLFDLEIIIRTVPAVMRRRGAY